MSVGAKRNKKKNWKVVVEPEFNEDDDEEEVRKEVE